MKRRTVLWLSQSDYNYLSTVAATDSDSKNRSMHVLLKLLQMYGVSSFRSLEKYVAPRAPIISSVAQVEKRTRPIVDPTRRVA